MATKLESIGGKLYENGVDNADVNDIQLIFSPTAWGNVANDGTLLAGENVRSTNTGTGSFEITFDTPMASTNYIVLATSQNKGISNVGVTIGSKNVNGFGITTKGVDNVASTDAFGFVIFGGKN